MKKPWPISKASAPSSRCFSRMMLLVTYITLAGCQASPSDATRAAVPTRAVTMDVSEIGRVVSRDSMSSNGSSEPIEEHWGTPDTLERAVLLLDKLLVPEVREVMLAQTSARDCAVVVHHGVGTWIRNNWGLWQGGPLSDDLSARGFTHPDDMSSVVLQCWCHLQRNETCDVEAMADYYRAYWQRMAFQPVPNFDELLLLLQE